MSNEEIAVRIQAGEIELMGQLWAGVEQLVKWKANRVSNAIGYNCGVDFDDLYQSGYLAMVEAVETYEFGKGSFTTWLMLHLKTAFAEATGYRTVKGRSEPLNNAMSLDKPLDNDPDGASFGDLVPDPRATASMVAVEEKLWREQLHKGMEGVLSELSPEQSTVLRCRYYECQTQEMVAKRLRMPAYKVQSLERKGLRELRGHKLARKIRHFYDFDYYNGTGLGAFQKSGMSIQERYLIVKEEKTEIVG